MVWKPVIQAASKVVQKEKREGETKEAKRCQKAEKKGFLVLELISSNRGTSAMFSCQEGGIYGLCQATEDREFPPKEREFQQLFGNMP